MIGDRYEPYREESSTSVGEHLGHRRESLHLVCTAYSRTDRNASALSRHCRRERETRETFAGTRVTDRTEGRDSLYPDGPGSWLTCAPRTKAQHVRVYTASRETGSRLRARIEHVGVPSPMIISRSTIDVTRASTLASIIEGREQHSFGGLDANVRAVLSVNPRTGIRLFINNSFPPGFVSSRRGNITQPRTFREKGKASVKDCRRRRLYGHDDTESSTNYSRDTWPTSVKTYRHVTPSLAELGARWNSTKMNKHILMLTRVPEAGAELLVLILQRLQGYNAFKHIRLPPGDHGLLSTLQEELLVEEITNIVRQEAIPLSFDGNVGYLNFSKFGRQAPTFVSLVRNPLGVQNLQRYREKRKTTNENRAIPTFCGQDPRCTEINNKWALERAKVNIAEWYPVVGILDCMEQSINLLEHKFPYFFRGARQIYRKIRPKKKSLSDVSFVPEPRERDILFSLFEDEIELYQWLKYRLFNETLYDVVEN
ncbi:uncharacterized protein LOC143153055 [Ptiloglossa arizonensis]|uniref:uncharacterized protein LOC143153055 n=1 Tax=Ptiloglossa arizonensis TaxID=3350558 RepID=UPI003F9EE1C6